MNINGSLVNYVDLQDKANIIRQDVIRMTYQAGNQGAHIGGSLSLCEIISVLYNAVMNCDSDTILTEKRDRLILSKGHGAIAMYAGLKQVKILTDNELMTYKQDGSYITAHPTLMPEKGMEFASGSLGQGLSIAVGVCLALKKKKNNSKVYVIMGDGECAEGSVWEAAAAAAYYELENVVSIIDRNKLQYDGETSLIMDMENMEEKWKSFGWDTDVIDGHNVEEIYQAITKRCNKPHAIICDTIKGKGVSFAENNYKYHNARLSEKQFQQAMQEQGVVI